MSKSYEFKNLGEATEVFPDLPWQADAGGASFVYDEKQEQYVPVSEGQYIVSIGDRYEVHDEEPAKAHPVEVEETKTAKKKADKFDSDAPTLVEPPAPKAAEAEK